jgi:hypothetical protein
MTESFSFNLRGSPGTVTIRFQANSDPDPLGYRILGLPWPSSLAEGLPVIEATVSLEADGYEAVMGWIQIVRIHVAESSEPLAPDSEKAPPGDHEWVDVPPNLHGLGVPFLSFGVRPTLFDAPASTESSVRFVADSFLTASPDGLITRVSRPCVGLRWGYSTIDGSDAVLNEPARIGAPEWEAALPILERQFPDWAFGTDWLV